MKANDKICPECHTTNKDSAKFCSQCGYKFNDSQTNIVCNQCGESNKQNARFCANCGNNLENKKQATHQIHTNKSKQKSRNIISANHKKTARSHTLPIIVIVVGLVLTYLFVFDNQDNNDFRNNQFTKNNGQNIGLNNLVYTVASRFTCSCGSCDEEALETCSCNTAVQEREFIKRELQKGKSFNQVIAAVFAQYGHPKPEFKNTIQQISDQDISQSLKKIDTPAFPTIPVQTTKLAGFQDLKEIYSHFECPCGQCGIPELTDCNCDHPGGATEVKAFINEKINEGNFTIAQIVEKVNEHYGHKIR